MTELLFGISKFQFINGKFIFNRSIPGIAAAGIIVFIIVYFFFRKTVPGLNLKEKIFIFFFRTIFVILLFFLLCEPVLKVPLKVAGKPYLVTLVDSSYSLLLKKGNNLLKEVIEDKIFNKLKNNYRILLYRNKNGFNAPVNSFNEIDFKGYKTDIGSSIIDINSEYLGEPAAAFIYFSDGLDNTGLMPERKIEREFRRSAPVFTIGTGYDVNMPEAGIDSVEYLKFAEYGSKHPVKVLIRNNGCAGKKAKLILEVEKVKEGEWEINFNASENLLEKTIEVPIKKTGPIHCRLILKPDFDDLYEFNNIHEFYIKGLKDNKIDVLFFSGRVDMEYKFLKETLEDDERFSMTSILRVSEDNNYVYSQHPERINLKKFPEKEEILKKFDIIILNEVKTDFLSQKTMENIIKVVEQGKGLIFFSGRNTFTSSGYIGSKFEKILPVYLNKKDEEYVYEKFKVKVSPVSRNFYILKNFVDRFEKLPFIKGFTKLYKVKPGAIPLLVHYRLLNEFGPRPIMALQRYGKGRVLTSATNSTWQWDVQTEKTDMFYREFWANIIGYMTPSEEKTIEVTAEKKRYHSGEQIIFKAENKYNILGTLKYTLCDSQQNILEQGKVENNMIDTSFMSEGFYSCELVIEDTSGIIDSDICSIIIDNKYNEITGKPLDSETLKKIAMTGEGEYFHIKDFDDIYGKLPRFVLSEDLTETVDLWNSVFFFILLILFITIEWVLRKKYGLL